MKQKTDKVVPVMRSIYLPLENVPTVGNISAHLLEPPVGKIAYMDYTDMEGATVFDGGNPEWMSYEKLMKYSSTHSGVSVTVYKAMSLLRGFLIVSRYPNFATEIGRIKFIKGDQVSVINIKNHPDEPAVGIDDGSNHSSGLIRAISSAAKDLERRINRAIIDIIHGK